MTESRSVRDYGWRDASPTPAHAYLEPAILAWLRRLRVRRVLDLGSGNGRLCQTLKDAGYDVVGYDADPHGIDIARAHSPDVRFEVVEIGSPGARLRLPREDPFDAVVSTEVVEHLYLPGTLPEMARSLLVDGGYFVVTTPYHGYLKNLALALSGRWDSHHTPLWDGGHIKFWSRATLTVLLEKHGFRVVGFSGAGRLPPLWKSMVLVARKA